MKIDILDELANAKSPAYLLHQVNCRGAWGAGLSGQISARHPIAEVDYRAHCQNYSPERLIGTYRTTSLGNSKYITHLFGQLDYGNDGKRYTNYVMLASAMFSFALKVPNARVLLPKGIGCGYGGGDWQIVQLLIKDTFAHRLTICEL